MTGDTTGTLTDWADLYAEHVNALSGLADELGDRTSTVVPATPGWTVRDVYAHLAGTASDLLGGRMDGAPGPGWTDRQVSERAQTELADVVTELQAGVPAVVSMIAGNDRPAVVWNLVVHHADLHEALGLHRMADHLWRPVLTAAVEPDPALAAVDPYELFRARFSRRTRDQLATWDTPLPLDDRVALGLFGSA